MQRRRARCGRDLCGQQQGRGRWCPANGRRHQGRWGQQRHLVERVRDKGDLIGPRRTTVWCHGMAWRGAAGHADRRVDTDLQGGQRQRPCRKADPLQQQQCRQQLDQPPARSIGARARPPDEMRPLARIRPGPRGSLVMVRFRVQLRRPSTAWCQAARKFATVTQRDVGRIQEFRRRRSMGERSAI